MDVCCVCCQVEVCCVCCVLLGRGLLCVLCGVSRGLCDELSLVQRTPTDCGASLCVITKPRERGGHSLRWAAEPEKINNISIIRIL
jgi:hypothetical protein